VTVKETSDPRIGIFGSNALAPAANGIGAEAKEVAVADFCDKAKFGESKSKFKCLVIHGVKNPSQDLQCSGERFEETRCQGSTLAKLAPDWAAQGIIGSSQHNNNNNKHKNNNIVLLSVNNNKTNNWASE